MRRTTVMLFAALFAWTARTETLEDAMREALANSRTIIASRATEEQAQHALAAARGARWPTATLSANDFHLDPAPVLDIPLPANFGGLTVPLAVDDHLRIIDASVGLPLFTSGRIAHAVAGSSAALDAAGYDVKREEAAVRLSAGEAYVAVLRARGSLAVAEQYVTDARLHLRDAENLLEQGIVANNDVLAARVHIADAEQKRIRAANAIALATAAYDRLLGRPLDQAASLEPLEAPAPPPDVAPLIAQALASRPELQMLAKQRRAIEERAASVGAELWPQAALTAHRVHLGIENLQENDLSTLGVNVQWRVFDRSTREEAAAIRSEARAVEARLSEAQSQVELQVRQAWLDAGEATSRINVSREAVAHADANVEVARDRYRSGIGTDVEVTSAEALRADAHDRYVNAVNDAALAALRLRHATGDL